MPVIQVKDKEHTLQPGATRVGAGPGVDISVSDDQSLGLQAVLELGGDNAVVIRRAREGASVRVNGVLLGVEPTPLIHGDKVDISGIEVRYSDDKKVGATQFVSKAEIAAAAAKRAGPARATSATGGRLVSLVDGKEYQISAAGITFGREAGSDVVVAQPEVSRRHATIQPAAEGYILKDHSTNGIWVNGTRVQEQQLLSRSDVVRVGTEEFRFYADVAASRPTPIAPSAIPAASAPTPPMGSASVNAPPPAPAAPPAPSVPTERVATITPGAPPPPSMSSPAPSASAGASAGARGSAAAPSSPRGGRPETTGPRSGTPTRDVRPKKETSSATRRQERQGMPSWLWLVIVLIVGALAYFLGQGRG